MQKQKFVVLAVLALLLAACGGLSQKYSEAVEGNFAVGDVPFLTVDNFTGDVIIHAGESGTIRVVATKRAAREKDLDRIDVEMKERDGGLEVVTDPPSGFKNVSVDLEITAPASTRVDVHTSVGDVIVRDFIGDVRADSSAGDVDIRGTSGAIEAHTGAGGIDVRDVTGPVYIRTNAGSIDYKGWPWGDCRFETDAGSVKIQLPTDVNISVDMDTSVGTIDVKDLSVVGEMSRRKVKGIIGSGTEGEIRVHTDAGSIDLIGD